ncbi:MAG: 5-aminolevulinate synthase [Rickettsiales bacterium]|nr:5-aminolevulinate synthase [Rickettsiales bacterium]
MFVNYEKLASEQLLEIKRKNLFREYPIVNLLPNNPPLAEVLSGDEKKIVTIWGNNNYLGLAGNSEIINAKISAIKEFGVGAGGTRNILGTSESLENLENKIANWFRKEKALIHNSALDANLGVISALLKNFNAIAISDEKNHASIIDGIKISGADKQIFKHNDLSDLENKLANIRRISDSRPIVILAESIYSMEGDFAPLKEIISLKKKYNAMLYLDEVHAIGVYGENGCGIAESQNLLNEIDIICGTFAKALGLIGGFVVGSKNMMEFIRHHSRNFIFSTAMQSDNAVACHKAIEIISSIQGRFLRKKHQEIIKETRLTLKSYGLSQNSEILSPDNSNIIPILIGSEAKTIAISKALLEEYNIAVTPIFAPTVPVQQARIRINPTPFHTRKMITDLAEALSNLLIRFSDFENYKFNDNQKPKDKNYAQHLISIDF